jgi:hypothetical protein
MNKKAIRGVRKALFESDTVIGEPDVTRQSDESSPLLGSDSINRTTTVQDVEENVVLFRPRLYWG